MLLKIQNLDHICSLKSSIYVCIHIQQWQSEHTPKTDNFKRDNPDNYWQIMDSLPTKQNTTIYVFLQIVKTLYRFLNKKNPNGQEWQNLYNVLKCFFFRCCPRRPFSKWSKKAQKTIDFAVVLYVNPCSVVHCCELLSIVVECNTALSGPGALEGGPI